MAHRLAREVFALAGILTLSFSLLVAPAAADHFLTHGDALKAKPVAQPVPSPLPATQQARAGTQDGTVKAQLVVVRDANIYLAPQAAGDDAVLRNYAADVAPQAKAHGVSIPGLLGIAAQAYRAKAMDLEDDEGGASQAYTLADAMRDAIWRKQTAQRLRDLFED